jgi:hypothetical protein
MLTHRTHTRLLRPSGSFVALCLFLTWIAVLSPPYAKGSPGEVIPPEIAQIREIRRNMERYVKRIKEEKKPDSEVYLEAKRLYEAAYVKYSAWDDETIKAIIAGRASKIAKDAKYGIMSEEYRKMSEEAMAAIAAFLAYYAENVGPVESGAYFYADWGIPLWNMYKFSIPRRRASSASFFEMMTHWRQWDDIKPEERYERDH